MINTRTSNRVPRPSSEGSESEGTCSTYRKRRRRRSPPCRLLSDTQFAYDGVSDHADVACHFIRVFGVLIRAVAPSRESRPTPTGQACQGPFDQNGPWPAPTLKSRTSQRISQKPADERSLGRQPAGFARTRPKHLSPRPSSTKGVSSTRAGIHHGEPFCRFPLAVWRTRRVPDPTLPIRHDSNGDSRSMILHLDSVIDQPPRHLDGPSCSRRSL